MRPGRSRVHIYMALLRTYLVKGCVVCWGFNGDWDDDGRMVKVLYVYSTERALHIMHIYKSDTSRSCHVVIAIAALILLRSSTYRFLLLAAFTSVVHLRSIMVSTYKYMYLYIQLPVLAG